jgi:Co/Zn/Cd efflux system component
MKRGMNDKTEGIIAILAAFFVLFSAMIDPLVSAVVAIGILASIGIWKISNK